MRGLASVLLIAAIVASTVGAGGFGYSFFADPNLLIPSIALIVVPWALWLPLRRWATGEGKAPFERALETIEPETANWYDGSGLALDRANGKLLVGGRGEVAVHAVTNLTDIHFVPESAAPLFGGGTASNPGSGLYLTLGGRKWHVSGIGSEEAGLWIYKLRQAAPQARFREPA